MGTNNWEVGKSDKTAAEFQSSGTSTGFDNVKNIIADKLHSVAAGFAENGADPDGESGIAKYGKQVSEWLDDSAEYVREFDCNEADSNIREFVRESPGRSLFIAGAVGLIIGALLRRR
jgi:ElaB/YqjD/DUF883 family membrane-anchored ribosome-binding protein